MPKLLVLSENCPVKEYSLGRFTTIGRHPSQDLQVLDRLISKQHCTIECERATYVLTDLNSRNGTIVNNRSVVGSIVMSNGDNITLGSTNLVFISEATEDSGISRVRIDTGASGEVHASRILDHVEFRPEEEISDVDELRGDYEKLRLAYVLNQEVALEYELNELSRKILAVLFRFFQIDRAVMFLVDPDTGEVDPFQVRSDEGEEDADGITVSHTIIDQVMQNREAVLSSDAMLDDRFSESHSVIMQGIRSTMTVPLLSSEDEVLGIIHMDSHVATNVFTRRDLQIIQGFASQAALAIENTYLMENIQQQEMARRQYERLLSPAVVEKIVSGSVNIQKGGAMRKVTVLFSDIRGFTSMSERIGAEEIVKVLNEYFEIMVEIVFEHEGTLDKFIGDAIMAIWGAPFSTYDDAYNAVASAVKMQQALEEFNEVRARYDLEPIEIGVGLDTGHIVAGYMGSSRKLEYTVIGNSVNRSARLCSLAKPGQVLISEETLMEVGRRVIAIEREPARLKGISRLVKNYEVTDLRFPD